MAFGLGPFPRRVTIRRKTEGPPRGGAIRNPAHAHELARDSQNETEPRRVAAVPFRAQRGVCPVACVRRVCAFERNSTAATRRGSVSLW